MTTYSLEPRPESEAAGVEVHEQPAHFTHVDDEGTMVEEDVLEKMESEKEGVLLEVDEADALFGKRGGVKDSHDRY